MEELQFSCRMRYAGVSAGAILAGRTCDTAYWKGWDDPTVVPEEALEESLATWQTREQPTAVFCLVLLG